MRYINEIISADALTALKNMDSNMVDMCVTSPPYYGLRDYETSGQIGAEETPEQYIDKLVSVFCEVKRVLKSDGTLWVNISDSYAGSGKGRMSDGTHHIGNSKSSSYLGQTIGNLKKTIAPNCKPKDLIGIPWLLAFALRSDGWYLRQDIIWRKPNAMPESVKDRCTKSYEHIFLLSKNRTYFFDHEAIKEPRQIKGRAMIETQEYRARRDVWDISTRGTNVAHFATFPEELAKICILAGSHENGIVLDPFIGSGTTAISALKENRKYIGIELNEKYAEFAEKRIADANRSLLNE